MVVLSIIVGILLMMGGISCMVSPIATYFETGYFLAILMLVYGIVGIINVITKRAKPIELIVHILAIIFGIIAIIKPGATLIFDGLMLYLISAWFVVQGIVSIVVSIQAKPYKKGWYWGLILGIIGVIVGIYSFFHPMVSAVTVGILIGIYLFEAGLNMIVLSTAVETVNDNQRKE